jgi:hypothetical protein
MLLRLLPPPITYYYNNSRYFIVVFYKEPSSKKTLQQCEVVFNKHVPNWYKGVENFFAAGMAKTHHPTPC